MPNSHIKFTKIERGSIFHRDFSPLEKNNEIEFSNNCNMVVVYAPNGTGKTSLIKVISGEEKTKLEFRYANIDYTSSQSVFHIITDQNNRNIIHGTAKDFLIGDNIRIEFELKEYIESELKQIKEKLIILLKTYGISSASSNVIELVDNEELVAFIKDHANTRSKGEKYQVEAFINVINEVKFNESQEYDERKLEFLKQDFNDKNSIIKQIDNFIKNGLSSSPKVREVEENTEAIRILGYFKGDQCIVCDNDIDRDNLLQSKTTNKELILDSLDDTNRKALEKIIDISSNNDPFQIKERLLNVLETAKLDELQSLADEINAYKSNYLTLLKNDISKILDSSELRIKTEQYIKMLEDKPDITEEDLIYIQEIISGSMDKKLEIERDNNKNLRIFLDKNDFLGISREDLPLSTGEQNFLSLTFEFLRAKNTSASIVVIDDPISSFDSIYKNKVVYALIRVLSSKQQIVLTHNIDLLRLLSAQYPDCYNLYILNNTENANNGFIRVNRNEVKMLINLEKLLKTFRISIFDKILDVELYLIAMIPFMRGYANLIDKKDISENLTQVMHGYKTGKVDIAKVYLELFSPNTTVIPASFEVNVDDILNKKIDGKLILCQENLPLLNKTLKNTLTYLSLRLYVEKSLVLKYKIDTTKHTKLGQIIAEAFPENSGSVTNTRNRVRLTSKKTLINEFNHYEGNLSIFQPAIDITDNVLAKESSDIYQFIENL